MYLLFCHDKKWKAPPDPEPLVAPLLKGGDGDGAAVQRKTIYFIRHGESTWNDTFNKGKHRSSLVFVLGFVPGLIKSMLYETWINLTGKIDSWFYDSPLSYLGLGQVGDMQKFILAKHNEKDLAADMDILNGRPGAPPSVIVCSSLRRALSTIAGGFSKRLVSSKDGEKIAVLPSLQEISRNPDTLSITPAHTAVNASWVDKSSTDICDFQNIFTSYTDMTQHVGNKPINTNGLIRMKEFCRYVFSSKGVPAGVDHVIVGGHSIWFRSFFRTYLPHTKSYDAKSKKIVNCGIVKFDLVKASTEKGVVYMVDPESIRVVYGGF